MSHRPIRDRVEDELFGRMAPKEENEDMAQTKRTRRIVEAAKGLLVEEPGLTAAELHDRLSRNGASLPLVKSFAPYVTTARKELGIDGRKAVAGHAQDPQGEDPAGASEAEAEDEAPAPPAEKEREEIDGDVKTSQGGKTPAEMLDDVEEAERLAARGAAAEEGLEELDRVSHTPARPARVRIAENGPRSTGGSIDVLHLPGGEVRVTGRGRLEWVKAMVAALPGEDGER